MELAITIPAVRRKLTGEYYHGKQLFYMHYVIKWKLVFNRRVAANEAEEVRVFAPNDF